MTQKEKTAVKNAMKRYYAIKTYAREVGVIDENKALEIAATLEDVDVDILRDYAYGFIALK